MVILIHTSVKLVTYSGCWNLYNTGILIHTSVKLVTRSGPYKRRSSADFNPHEREARDGMISLCRCKYKHFNPHEREARDNVAGKPPKIICLILIHTSVKLVT